MRKWLGQEAQRNKEVGEVSTHLAIRNQVRIQIQIQEYKYENTNTQMQMHKYKYFTKKAAEKKVEQPLQCIEKRDNCITRNQIMVIDKIQQNEKFEISDLIWERADPSAMIIREWKFLCTTAKDLWNKVQLWEKRKGRQCQFSDDHFWSKVELS